MTTCQHALEGLPSTLSTASLHVIDVREFELRPATLIGEYTRRVSSRVHDRISPCKMMANPMGNFMCTLETTDTLVLDIFSCDTPHREEAGMLQSILLEGTNLLRFRSCCAEFHGSVSGFMLQLKMMMAHYFSNTGTYNFRVYHRLRCG